MRTLGLFMWIATLSVGARAAEVSASDEVSAPDEVLAPEGVSTPEEALAPEEVSTPVESGSVDASLTLSGTYLLGVGTVGEMRVDQSGDGVAEKGETFGQGMTVLHRLRFEPKAVLHETLTLEADFQLAAGYLSTAGPNNRFVGFGAPRDSSLSAFGSDQSWADQFGLRKAMFTWRSPIGAIIAGRMASQWGMGLLANSGDDDMRDWGGIRFGDDRNYGDIVNRILFATKPLAFASDADWANCWTFAIGADLLQRDERFSLPDGDTAAEAIGALRYEKDGREAGIYVAYRDLEDRNNDTLTVWAIDFFGKGSMKLGDLELGGMGEVAWVTGDTTLARNNAFTNNIDVEQLGYVLRAGATYLPFASGLDVEVGYASGDSNANDGHMRNFSFDPEYNPSLVLFDELRAAETVAAAANASDPARVGYPPDSVRLLPTNGAVTNAIYVRPTIRVSSVPLLPKEFGELGLRVALLYAVAEEDMVDPFASTLAGGVTINHQGGDGSKRDLGMEIDIGLDYNLAVDRWAALNVGVQYGHLIPGAAFNNLSGESHPGVDVLYGRLLVRWLPPAPVASDVQDNADLTNTNIGSMSTASTDEANQSPPHVDIRPM